MLSADSTALPTTPVCKQPPPNHPVLPKREPLSAYISVCSAYLGAFVGGGKRGKFTLRAPSLAPAAAATTPRALRPPGGGRGGERAPGAAGRPQRSSQLHGGSGHESPAAPPSPASPRSGWANAACPPPSTVPPRGTGLLLLHLSIQQVEGGSRCRKSEARDLPCPPPAQPSACCRPPAAPGATAAARHGLTSPPRLRGSAAAACRARPHLRRPLPA